MNKTSTGSLGGAAQEGSKAGAPGNAPRHTPAVGKQPTLQKANAATRGLSLHQRVCPGSASRKGERQKVPTLHYEKEWMQFYPESNWVNVKIKQFP